MCDIIYYYVCNILFIYYIKYNILYEIGFRYRILNLLLGALRGHKVFVKEAFFAPAEGVASYAKTVEMRILSILCI